MKYIEFLCDLWTSSLVDSIRTKEGNLYGYGFYEKHYKICMEKIINVNEYPSNAIRKLIKLNKCSYCKKDLDFKTISQGDHIIADFENRNLVWTVPCDKKCNSSKGKKDLIDWWVNHKGYDFSNMMSEVVGVFVRAKYRHLKNLSLLFESPPEVYFKALNQIKEHWKTSPEGQKVL